MGVRRDLSLIAQDSRAHIVEEVLATIVEALHLLLLQAQAGPAAEVNQHDLAEWQCRKYSPPNPWFHSCSARTISPIIIVTALLDGGVATHGCKSHPEAVSW